MARIIGGVGTTHVPSIGKAIAETLAKHGVTVICVSKSADSCGATAAAINAVGGKAKALAVDVADGAAIVRVSRAAAIVHSSWSRSGSSASAIFVSIPASGPKNP